jgi:hypothetical protein
MADPQKPQMHLVTFKNTGHVLGVMTRTADMNGAMDPTAFMQNGVQMLAPFDGTSATAYTPPIPTVLVSLDQLGIVTADLARQILLHPTNTAVATGGQVLPLAAGTPAAQLTLNVNTLTVTADPSVAPVTVDTNFWVLLQEASPTDPANPGRRVTRGVILKGTSNGTAVITITALPLDAPSNAPSPPAAPVVSGSDYFAVVFIAQHAPVVAKITAV